MSEELRGKIIMSQVTSKPMENGRAEQEKTQKASAVVTRGQLAKSRGKVERLLAFGILVISFLGTVVALHGGWEPILNLQISLGACGGGILIQSILTYVQWTYKHNRRLSWGSRLIDAYFTATGYGPVFVPALALWFVARGVSKELVTLPWFGALSAAILCAWAIVGLVSLLAAWYPEDRLVG
jgi:hypothetical protein